MSEEEHDDGYTLTLTWCSRSLASSGGCASGTLLLRRSATPSRRP